MILRDPRLRLSPLYFQLTPSASPFVNTHRRPSPSPTTSEQQPQYRLTSTSSNQTTMSAASAKKSKPAAKKATTKSTPSHPSWADMIKVRSLALSSTVVYSPSSCLLFCLCLSLGAAVSAQIGQGAGQAVVVHPSLYYMKLCDDSNSIFFLLDLLLRHLTFLCK